jgi:hypothetical protein
MKNSEFRNLIKRELIKEAKGTSYEAKLAEIENQGHITTLEAKIDAISEMIDAKNDRLSLVNEDENLAELIDKKKIKEMQKEIKQLEKTKMKLEKLYEKKTGGKKKDVVIDEDARTDAEEEGYIDGMEDEKEDVEEACSTSYEEDDTDSMNEEFNLRKYMSEGRLLKEDLLDKIKQIQDYETTEDSLDYNGYFVQKYIDGGETIYVVWEDRGENVGSDPQPDFESTNPEAIKKFLQNK